MWPNVVITQRGLEVSSYLLRVDLSYNLLRIFEILTLTLRKKLCQVIVATTLVSLLFLLGQVHLISHSYPLAYHFGQHLETLFGFIFMMQS